MSAGQDHSAQRLAFDDYVLDLARGCLLRAGQEVTLRPKTFAVLRYLVEHMGELVSKETLLAAVWPNLIVTDDTLVQSIGELRRAFAEAGRDYITTVPRRGYRFEPPRAAAPNAGRVKHAFRWRWKYGIAAPLALAVTVAALWFAMRPRDTGPEAATGARPAIAVLPFQNQNDAASREYLADGLTQDLINSLGRFSALTVMSWNAVASYKGALAKPGEIARVLGVRYQVEGSVRYSADRVRVSAQLVDAQGRVLWSSRFDEAAVEVFQLQDRMTREIAGALAIRVTEFEQQRIARKPTASFDAYDCVLRARPALQRPTRAGLVEARTLLRRAIELDPDYAAPHSALGDTFHAAVSMGWAEAPEEYWAKVVEQANEALRLDAGDTRARILLGRRYIAYNQFDEARAQIDRAIAMNPSDADALAGRGNILVWLGEEDAAIESLELAQRIDPELNAFDRFALSLAYYLKGRYQESIEQAELNLRRNADARFNYAMLAAAHAEAGHAEEAARAAEALRHNDPLFESETFGNKFRDPRNLAHVRAGLEKAGLYRPGS
jgi:TolB-like protein/DNA-binding winged helix-turn-helix (wHTH) protein/cytochrome c-type biogenesis protein CcmH/NrfG